MKFSKKSTGFTLIELLVVISIIGLLASIVVANLSEARTRGRITRAQAELTQMRTTLAFLEEDSGQLPGHLPLLPCVQNQESYISSPQAGIISTDGSFPGWRGPYMSGDAKDPWGNDYIFDPDYLCGGGMPLGCEGITSGKSRVLHSGGPNGSGINVYDADNIVLVLCSP